jgi:predicted regulator of Ras-like GTPase activity (Roadblock/LC7/MglB family)
MDKPEQTTRTSAPTPGPWRLERRNRGVNGAWIVGADGTHIASLSNRADKSTYQKEADGEIIVAAVNAALEAYHGR